MAVMNAARLARALEQGGFNHDQALVLSESLADEIEQTVATKEQVELVVTREIHALRSEVLREISALRGEMQRDNGALRGEMLRDNGALRGEMIGAMADLKTSMIKWMIGLMIGQLGLILVVGNMLWGR